VTVQDVLAQATAAGLTLEAAGDRLRVRPRDRLTPELRAALLAHKPALLALLGGLPDPATVAARAAAFQAQLAAWRAEGRAGVPVLRLAGLPPIAAGQCVGCGAALPPERTWRCGVCQRAVAQALGLRSEASA